MLDEQLNNTRGMNSQSMQLTDDERKKGVKMGYLTCNILVLAIGMFQFGKHLSLLICFA